MNKLLNEDDQADDQADVQSFCKAISDDVHAKVNQYISKVGGQSEYTIFMMNIIAQNLQTNIELDEK